MSTDRDELDGWSKGDLIARAESLGIEGAAKYTKVELLDEIRRAVGAADRGFLGKARDVLRGVVEKGLARALGTETAAAPAPSVGRGPGAASGVNPEDGEAAEPLASRTLAEIHLAQGDRVRARAILEVVVRAHPDDDEAAAMLAALGAPEVDVDSPAAAPSPAAEPAKAPAAEVDVEALAETLAGAPPAAFSPTAAEPPVPPRYDVDECVAMPVDARTLYVYWEARAATIARARRVLGAAARPNLRVLVVEPSTHGPRVQTRDVPIEDANLASGEMFIRELPPAAILRAAIGFSIGDRFLPIAHTADVESPAEAPSPVAAHETGVWSPPGEAPPPVQHAGPADAPVPMPRRLPTTQPDFSQASTFDDSNGAPPSPEELADLPEEILGRGLSSAELSDLRRRVRMGAGAPPPHLAGAAAPGPGGEAAGAGIGPGAGASEQWAQPTSSSWGAARP